GPTIRSWVGHTSDSYSYRSCCTFNSPDSLQSIEPSIVFVGDLPASVGSVSVDRDTPLHGGVFIASTRSASRSVFCIAAASSGPTAYGTKDAVDARSPSGCGSPTGW